MKRTKFFQACLTASILLATPFRSLAHTVRTLRVSKGFKVDAGKDRFDKPISLLEGDTFSTKVSTKDTDGDLYMFESIRVKEGGPSHHVHFEQDEWWYVLQGQFLIKVGDEIHQAKAGDSVFGPRNIPHSFAKVGEGEGRLLMFFQPAGKMEEFFTKLSEGVSKNMTEPEQDAFREAHGFKRVGPPIKNFKKW
ncbi:cupin domain-containing protein [Spirosoma montaniterrae]|uniref:Cupin n=1 Tax=Spirosoma montaniterrae TaxID=1178516 RepID=A0A1P9X469_9BACT|nr:cupin domain-containing protein [Spirosoma montaniterrae]AQG82432.1 cupin [Spirosoma montaniterrae]